jgi:tetratricopeptide (TPR) repeat protein
MLLLKPLQNIKTRLLTTGLTTIGTIGLSGYLASAAQTQSPQNIETTAISFLAGVLAVTAPKLLDVILGVTGNIISGDLHEKLKEKEFYKHIPSQANLYEATYFAFKSILYEISEAEENKADKKIIEDFNEVSFESWVSLIALDELADDRRERLKEILTKFTDGKIIENQFLKGQNASSKNEMTRQDWLILLQNLEQKENKYLTENTRDKILDSLESNFTERLGIVLSEDQNKYQQVTLQLWEILFGKLEEIHEDLRENAGISKDTNQELKDFRREFKESQKQPQTISTISKPRGLINLPREKNDYFVEQSNVFARIDAELAAHNLAYLHGTHGLGKTTTLNEYAYSRGKDYDFVVYILATNGAIETEMARVADEYLENVAAEDTPAIKAAKFKHYLEENERWTKETKNWLIIFDNLESAENIAQYFPRTSKGNCLYACNEKLFIGNDREVEFEQFSQAEAELFVYQRLRKDSQIKHADISPENLAEVNKLIGQLGRLPLALNIATAYLIETKVSIDVYVGLLKANVQKFLKYKDAHKEHQNNTAFDAFLITLDKISSFKGEDDDGEIIGKLAETFLGLLIFCAPEDIPEELIKDTLIKVLDTAETQTPPEILFRETAALLKRYGLIKEQEKPFKYKEKVTEPIILPNGTSQFWEEKETVINVFNTYRTLQDVLSVKLETEAKKSLLELLLIIFNGLLPNPEVTTWEIFGKYSVHAFSIAEQSEKLTISNEEGFIICNQIGSYFDDIAKYREAEYFYLRGKTIAEEFYGKQHNETATSYNNLALLYKSQGRYEKAEPLFKNALEIYKQVLGKNHLHTATSYNNLAVLYYLQGRYEEAELLFKNALEICEQVLDKNHPNTAQSVNNLAELYHSQGRYEEAGPLFKKVIDIFEQILGENHPDTATSYNNLAELYRTQGRYEEAEPLHKKVIDIFEQILGENHPDTATSYNNLALLYKPQGRYEEAESLYKKALDIREQVLGGNHPLTASSYLNLGAFYYQRENAREGLKLCEKALEIFQNTLPTNHPRIQNCKDWVTAIKNSIGE